MLHRLTHSAPTRRSSDLPTQKRIRQPPFLVEGAMGVRHAELFGHDERLHRRQDMPKLRQAAHAAKGARRRRPEAERLAAEGDIGLRRSEEHTSELQSLMRNSYAVFCLKKKNHKQK